MNKIISRILVLAVLATLLLFLSASSPASIFSGWKPFRKPLEPAKKATEEVAKAISGSKPTLPPAAQEQVEKIEEKAKVAEKENEKAQEALGGQRDTFLLTAAGLALTNIFTLGGLWRGRTSSRLADQRAQLEIELLKAKLAAVKSGTAPSVDETL
jgi:hypothetical protein